MEKFCRPRVEYSIRGPWRSRCVSCIMYETRVPSQAHLRLVGDGHRGIRFSNRNRQNVPSNDRNVIPCPRKTSLYVFNRHCANPRTSNANTKRKRARSESRKSISAVSACRSHRTRQWIRGPREQICLSCRRCDFDASASPPRSALMEPAHVCPTQRSMFIGGTSRVINRRPFPQKRFDCFILFFFYINVFIY